MKVEWDDHKAASNKRKYGISFGQAVDALGSHGVIEDLDDGNDEERFRAMAMLDDQVLVIIYTHRGDSIRLISARKAEKHEQQDYYRQTRP